MGKQNTSITLNWVASLFEDATSLATNKIWTRKELKMRNSSQTVRLHIGKFVVWLRLWNSLLLIYFLFISKSWYWHRTKLNLKLWCRTCTILYYFYVIDFQEKKIMQVRNHDSMFWWVSIPNSIIYSHCECCRCEFLHLLWPACTALWLVQAKKRSCHIWTLDS